MNLFEVGKLLAIVSGFDRRVVDELTTMSWQSVLTDVDYEQAKNAVIEHFKDPNTRHEYFNVGHLLDRVEASKRTKPFQIEADVRSAKARELISDDWPYNRMLPVEVSKRLAELRLADQATSMASLELEAKK